MIRRHKTWLSANYVPQKWAKGGQKVGSGQLCNPFFKTGQLCKNKSGLKTGQLFTFSFKNCENWSTFDPRFSKSGQLLHTLFQNWSTLQKKNRL